MSGFRKFGGQFDSLYNKNVREGTIRKNVVLLSDFWFPAAHIDYYVARPCKTGFMAVGDINAIHNYAWLNTYRNKVQPGGDAYYITVSNYFHPVPEWLAHRFTKVTATPEVITQYREGVAVRIFFIYRLTGCRGNFPADGILN